MGHFEESQKIGKTSVNGETRLSLVKMSFLDDHLVHNSSFLHSCRKLCLFLRTLVKKV